MHQHSIAGLRGTAAGALVALILVLGSTAALAHEGGEGRHDDHQSPNRGWHGSRHGDDLFRWAGTFDVMAGNGSAVAEIVDVSNDGNQAIYTDAGNEEIGFVDIRNLRHAIGQGTVAMPGEPTSLAILGPLVLVAVNTSESFTSPSGQLVVVHRFTRQIVATHDLGGQPDSIAIAPDGKRAVIVIENERDEDVGGGLLPQYPSGTLKIVDMQGPADAWSVREADLSPVAEHAFEGSDLEPEFVDVNRKNLAVVTFQENNHIAVVDIVSGKTVSEFPAGSVDLDNVDTVEDDLIILDSKITKRREPDAVAWIDDDSFATANEGDYEDASGEEGGSRGFTVFNINGAIEHESHESFEHLLVSIGHYNEGRSENKGVEPESAETGWFGRRNLLFIGSERSNAIGVYDVTDGEPRFVQVLPTGIGPEGLKAFPKRKLLLASTETDVADDGIPTMINFYRQAPSLTTYPMIESGPDDAGLPIGWVALSGMAGDPWDADTVYAVSDSFLADGFIYSIDVSRKPALIYDRLKVSGASVNLDLEGIAVGPDGSFWLASEGNASSRPNVVLKVDPATGMVMNEFQLPPGLEVNARSNGFEGVAVTGEPGAETVYVAVQRAWPAAGDTDAVETKLGRLDPGTGEWGFVYYPLEPLGNGGWIGLSELTALPDGSFAVVERDKGWGPSTPPVAELKALFHVDLAGADFRAYDDPNGLVTVEKRLIASLEPLIARRSIWTAEKLEGVAVTADGRVFAVTDNDGVDDATGETVFLRLGRVSRLLR
ncbi:MAG: esterase-like activity of phytase family protein [Pseudomonadales bacterium]